MKKREDRIGQWGKTAVGQEDRIGHSPARLRAQDNVQWYSILPSSVHCRYPLDYTLQAVQRILRVLPHTGKEQSRGFTKNSKVRRSETWEGLSRLLASENPVYLLYSLTISLLHPLIKSQIKGPDNRKIQMHIKKAWNSYMVLNGDRCWLKRIQFDRNGGMVLICQCAVWRLGRAGMGGGSKKCLLSVT